MKIAIPILVVLVILGILLFRRKKQTCDSCEMLAERGFQFLETFCRLREEQEVLGSAYLTFRRESCCRIRVRVEMMLFFSGSMVTLREELGSCLPDEKEALKEMICLRVIEAHSFVEIDAGDCRICFR